jgi:hypothetical protein
MAMIQVKSIADLNYGAVNEQFDKAFNQLIDNMLDPSTEAKKARSIVITIKVIPSEDRSMAQTEVDVKTKLAPIMTDSGSFVLDADDSGRVVAKTGKPENQGILFEEPEKVAK